jgi:hypothetical protein
MSWSENISREDITDPLNGIESEKPENMGNSLFADDAGELPLDTRRALVQLLSGPSLDGHRHSKLWSVLLRDEDVIRRRLADLFLELIIDRDLQVAFIRQFDTDDLDAPTLLRRAQLTFIDSVLLLYLRQQLAQAASRGERAVVSKTDIVEHLIPYDRQGNTDRAGFDKRVYASIEKIKKYNIIQKIRASDDRFEVSPTLKLLFSAEEIQALTTVYQGMTADGLQDGSGDAPQKEADYKSGEEE